MFLTAWHAPFALRAAAAPLLLLLQVRLYAPYLMAEVTMQGDNMREAMSGKPRGIREARLLHMRPCRQDTRRCLLSLLPLPTLPVPQAALHHFAGGFRSIAGFIFGKNEAPGSPGSSSKVAMTSPVTLEMQQGLLDSSSSGGGGGGSSKIAMTSPVTAEMGPGGAGVSSMRRGTPLLGGNEQAAICQGG